DKDKLPHFFTEDVSGVLKRTTRVARKIFFNAEKNPSKISVAAVSVNTPPDFIYREIEVFFTSRNPVLYQSNIHFSPAACAKNIAVKRESLQLSKEAEFYTGHQKVLARRDGEIGPATCSLVFYAETEIAHAQDQPRRVESTVSFRRLFGKSVTGKTEKTESARVFYHAGSKNDALAEKVLEMYEYMQESPAFGKIPYRSDIYAFKDTEEMYLAAGSTSPLSIPGLSLISAKDSILCPAIAAHEINHLAYFANIDRYPREVFEPLQDESLFWLSEGSANFFARKATGYSLTSKEILWLLKGQVTIKTPPAERPPISVNFEKLKDLEQVIRLEKKPPDIDFFKQMAGYHGSNTFLEYLEARFGLEKIEKFYREIAESNDAKKSMEKAFSIGYPELRKGFNKGLQELNRIFSGPLPPIVMDPEELDWMGQEEDCVNPQGMKKEAAKAQKALIEYAARIGTGESCETFRQRIRLENQLVQRSPPLAVMRASGVLDAARANGCMKGK
ncbi:MAG TPA: hypothetical protein VI874_05030, partial [Candidatus Norongarragalinales archaeon]|nr:hypothetical protein [Candidatus Norongarragalinales archaeon]